MEVTRVIGFVGAGISAAAYVPQIYHLIAKQCSAGISLKAFAAWFLAALLLSIHAVAIRADVFIALGLLQIVATLLILFFGHKYRGKRCAAHTRER